METPTFDPLLDELKRMRPLYDDPAGQVPAKQFLRLADLHVAPSILRKLQSPPKTGTELSTGGATTKVPAVGKQSNAKPATTKAPTSKPATTTKPPAPKADVRSSSTTIIKSAGGSVPSKATPFVKRDDDGHAAKIQPRPIQKKQVQYVEIHSSDASSGEEGEGQEEEEEEESDEEEEEEEVVVKKIRRRVVKSAAVITDEMDNADGERKGEKHAGGGKVDNNAGGGKKVDNNAGGGGKDRRIPWSAADIEQAELDAEWAVPDRDDPCVVNWNSKDIRYGPLYWGSYHTPLAMEGPISKEELTNRNVNPHDRDGHAKYILADVYDTPCRSCSRATPPRICVFAGLKPNPLGATVGEEEKNAAACGYCKHIKRKCEEHSRGRTRQIVDNPFHDHSATRGGSAKGKAKAETKAKAATKGKGETKAKAEAKTKAEARTKAETNTKVETKVTPAAKSRGSRRVPSEQEVTMGK